MGNVSCSTHGRGKEGKHCHDLIYGVREQLLASVYAATKAGIIDLLSHAAELNPSGIYECRQEQ